MQHYGLSKFQRIYQRWLGERREGDGLSEAEQLKRVLEDPSFIQHIRRPGVFVQLAAVEHDGTNLRHIIDPHVKAQLKAICNPKGLAALPWMTGEGYLNPRKMGNACPALIDAIDQLKALGMWPADNDEDLELAAATIKAAVLGNPAPAPKVDLPTDLDGPLF